MGFVNSCNFNIFFIKKRETEQRQWLSAHKRTKFDFTDKVFVEKIMKPPFFSKISQGNKPIKKIFQLFG